MVFMMFMTNVFKEVILPNLDNTDYRVLIDKKLFEVRRSFYLKFEIINHKWRLNADSRAYKIIHNKQEPDFVELSGREIITIKTNNGDIIKGITFDDEMSLMSFKKYDILRTDRINIGKAEDNTIRYEFMNLVSMKHCSIERVSGGHILCNTSKNGVFVNHRRVYNIYTLVFGDIVEIFGLRIVYLNELIAVGSRVKSFTVSERLKEYYVHLCEKSYTPLKHCEHYFNRSPRIFSEICTEQIVIDPPTNPQISKKKSLLMTIGPSFTMAIPMLIGSGLMIFSSMMSGGATSAFMFTGMITALGSAVMGSIWAFMNIRNTKQSEIEDETKRFNTYGNYLLDISEYIKEKYRQNTDALYRMYPSPSECCKYSEASPELWNRNVTHSDFLFYRLGVGDIDFQVDIQIPKEKFSMQFDNLKDKPAMIYDNFKTLRNVPVGLDFSESNIYGIVGGERMRGAYDIVNNIVTQIAATASYTDVKIAFCFDSKKYSASKWGYLKWLPHIWSENKKTRYYATDRQEAADVFFELSNIIRQRAEEDTHSSVQKVFRPHYFLFVSDASFLDGEIIGKYVYDTHRSYGLTTFIMADYYQNLPNVCENIIQNDDSFHGCYNALNSTMRSVEINFDRVSVSELESFAKRLSNISIKEHEDDSNITASLDFFEMYGVRKLEDFRIAEQWRKNRTYNSMRALIGKKMGGADCYLDIHEKYHGPHGLVAGTTGSGKSELLQTYMLSLAINYSPDDVAFFVIDFKGGGMANLFSGLPHMAGQISNLSGNQISRAMISIKSENMRRQKIFSSFGVNNINNYTRLYKSGEAHLPIPHLLIIIDEFAELKKEEPEFMRELISVAQVGRSLGVHLILATQKPSGTVDDNIWSNSKFRLCLRVQDRQDSNDMLHKPDAAYITQAGRCYLQVGNDEIFELFQSGWSGAVYENNPDGDNGEIASMITTTGKEALVGSHLKIKLREKERLKWLGFLYSEASGLLEKNDDTDNITRQLIRIAQENNYNIGTNNSDIQAVKNFVELIPDKDEPKDAAVSFIVEKASKSNIKLPELKEKTQLEVLVDYIGEVAVKEHYTHKAQMWMPLLKEEIILHELFEPAKLYDGKNWRSHEKWTLDVPVGMYDDPENQEQFPFEVDFSESGHIAICGAVVSGKSTFLQTLLCAMALKYSPDEVNFYILDFSSGALAPFEAFPHTGGVIRENDLDKTGKFFNMMASVVEERKKLFNGGNFSQYVKVNGMTVPSIVIAIDNFAGFREKTENAYEDILINLAREGVGYGIFLAISSAGFGMTEIPNRIGDNIRTVVSLEMSDKFKYMDVLRTTHIGVFPEPGVKGRGIGYVEGRILEFQTALAFRAEDDYKRIEMIEKLGNKMKSGFTGRSVQLIPHIPENPQYSDLAQLEEYAAACADSSTLPYAYKSEDASVYSVNLAMTYCYIISGKKRTGKTNALKLLMLASMNKKARRIIIEKNASELVNVADKEKFLYISDDMGVLNFFKSISDDFRFRNKQKKSLEEQGLSDEEIFEQMQIFEPIFIFVADLCEFINTIYHPQDGIGNLSGFFENIFEKGYLHNIFFFACFNTDEASTVAGLRSFNLFTSYKTGVHLGGNVSSQRIFSFQNIHYSQLSKTSKKGEGLVPSAADESISEKIILPLAGGRKI